MRRTFSQSTKVKGGQSTKVLYSSNINTRPICRHCCCDPEPSAIPTPATTVPSVPNLNITALVPGRYCSVATHATPAAVTCACGFLRDVRFFSRFFLYRPACDRCFFYFLYFHIASDGQKAGFFFQKKPPYCVDATGRLRISVKSYRLGERLLALLRRHIPGSSSAEVLCNSENIRSKFATSTIAPGAPGTVFFSRPDTKNVRMNN